MRDNLDDSLELLFGDEGGYVNVKTDRGGPTKYGITHKTLAGARGLRKVSAADVQALTIAEAEAIYRSGYWGQAGCDQLPVGLDYAVFDSAVMSGPQAGVKQLQRVLSAAGVYHGEIDGWAGGGTIKGAEEYPGGIERLIVAYIDERMRFLRSLTNPKTGFPVNGNGWTYRLTGVDPRGKLKRAPGVVGDALAMARKQKPKAKVAIPVDMANAAKAKADPVTTIAQAVAKPEVLLPAGGAALTAAAPVVAGSNALQYALSFGIVVLIVIGAIYAVRRIRAAS